MTEYTVFLEVKVQGPEAEWDLVAQHLAKRVEGLSLVRGGSFQVVAATVDTADEESVD